jgi:riboflavin synthase
MFSGIIEDLGTVEALRARGTGAVLTVASRLADSLQVGDSIAVNGACLTAVTVDGGRFTADLSPTTIAVTALGTLKAGDRVNLEAALRMGDRLSGHLVSGHVDAVGKVLDVTADGDSRHVDIGFPPEARPLLTDKGSITVDGISLTVVMVGADRVRVTLIPHTQSVTTAQFWAPGRAVQLEFDMVAKYVRESLMPWVSTGGPEVAR